MSEPFYLHKSNILNKVHVIEEDIPFDGIYQGINNSEKYRNHFTKYVVTKRTLKKFRDKNIGDIVPDDFTKLKLSTQSVYSSAMNEDAIITAQYMYDYYQFLINRFVKEDVVLTDACANVGSNTIRFAFVFDKVNAVEYSYKELNRLKNNIQQYSLQNVTTRLGSYTIHRDKLEQDIIFFDPPWGGPDYKNYKKLGLSLGSNDITEDIEQLLDENKARLVVLKGPENTYIKNTKYLKSKVKFYISSEKSVDSELVEAKSLSLFHLFFFHKEDTEEVESYVGSLQNYTEESNINDNKMDIEYISTTENNLPTRIVNQIKVINNNYNVPVNVLYNIDNTHYESIISYKTELDETVITDIQPNFKYHSRDIDKMLNFSISRDSQLINKEKLRREIYQDIIDNIEEYFNLLNLKYKECEVKKMVNNYIFNKMIEKKEYDDEVIIGTHSELANSKIFSDLKYCEKSKNINIDKRDKYNIINKIQSLFSRFCEYLVTDKIMTDGPVEINTENKYLIYSYSENNMLTNEYEQKSISIKVDDYMLEKLGDKVYKYPNNYIACFMRYDYLDLNTTALAFDYENEEITSSFDKDTTLECFASVYNFYYTNWCSAFPEIEHVFGSVGSFWDISNNYILSYDNIVVNPPFDVNIIDKTLNRFDEIIFDIKANQLRNRIVIILPHWEDLKSIKRYKDNYKYIIIPKNETRFIDYFGGKKIIQPVNIIVFTI